MNNDKVISIMEVRIKDANGYVDADWTIEDGIMVVSPKTKEEFNPKDGDIVSIFNRYYNVWMLAIFHDSLSTVSVSAYCMINAVNDLSIGVMNVYINEGIRPATEEEKQKLFAKLAEEGYSWDSEKRELVKIKWKPKDKESYYYPSLYGCEFNIGIYDWKNNEIDKEFYNKGWCFKTETECQAFCQKLNEAINQVKP